MEKKNNKAEAPSAGVSTFFGQQFAGEYGPSTGGPSP